MNALSKEHILKYLQELSEEIGKEGIKGEILQEILKDKKRKGDIE